MRTTMTINRVPGRWAIVWQKQFRPGAILEGLTITETLRFIDRWHAAQWLRGVRRNIRAGRLEWTFAGRPVLRRTLP